MLNLYVSAAAEAAAAVATATMARATNRFTGVFYRGARRPCQVYRNADSEKALRHGEFHGFRRGWRLVQRQSDRLPHRVHQMDRHHLAYIVRHVLLQVLLVPLRQDQGADPSPVSRDHLLLDPPDREHASGPANLAGHGEPPEAGPPRQERDERRRDRDAGRGPGFRDRSAVVLAVGIRGIP